MHESFFKSYFANKVSAVSGTDVFEADNKGIDGFLDFFGCRINLARKTSMQKLEEHFLSVSGSRRTILDSIRPQAVEDQGGWQKEADKYMNNDANYSLALFVVKELCKSTGGNKALAESVLPRKDLLVMNSRIYPLFDSPSGEVLLNGKRFHLGLSQIASLESIEEQYRQRIKSNNLSNSEKQSREYLANGSFYDNSNGMGFKILDKRFYLFTRIQPYILFERKNNSYYQFEEAEVGSPLFWKENKIVFGKLYVLNKYTHPALPGIDREMQCICVGNYDYDAIKRRHPHNAKAMLEELVEKARTILTEEYRSNGKPYAFLTDSRFSNKRISGQIDKNRVTNAK